MAAPTRRGKKPDGPLNDELRTEIVTRLAMHDSPSEIHKDFTERGIKVTATSIARYNPLNGSNVKLADRWRTLFTETRDRFTAEVIEEPIANRVYRLRRLHKLYLKAEARGAIPVAAALLEQAAKEVGNVFSNVTKVKGSVQHNHEVVTTDEKRNMLEDRLASALLQAAKKKGGDATTRH